MDERNYARYTALICEQCGVKNVVPETRFDVDLGMDSLDTVELIMDIEETFSVTIPDDEVYYCRTVGDLWKLIEGKINASTLDR